MKHQELSFFKLLKKYFNINADKEDEQTTIENVESSISFHGAQLWILIFAIFIASLGLNVNSTAVIIGIYDIGLLKRSAINYLIATVISVLTATIYFLITPLNEAHSE